MNLFLLISKAGNGFSAAAPAVLGSGDF